MPTATRPEGDMFYEDAGSGDPPLVLVHGVGNHDHYRAQLHHFSQRHRVVAPDLPGYGHSDRPDRDYTVESLADDVAWLCDELDLRQPVLVGHSMGAAVALQLCATRPDLPSGIVLLDPTPITPVPLFRERMEPFLEALSGPEYRQAMRGFAQARMFRPSDESELRERIIEEMCAVAQPVLAATLRSVATWNGGSAASRVRVPALLIQAGDGMPVDLTRTRELLPALELGRTVGAGHFAHLLVPDQVNAMVERFLAVSVTGPAVAQGD